MKMAVEQSAVVKSVVVKKRSDAVPNTSTDKKLDSAKKNPNTKHNKWNGQKQKGVQNGRKPAQQNGKTKQKAQKQNRAENKQYTDEMLQAMTRDELNTLALAQSDEVARITNQLDQAKALQKSAGVKMDARWIGQATCAKRMKGNLLSRIYLVINQKKKAHNMQKGQNFERAFINMAKDLLSDEQYNSIMDAARVEVALKAA